MGGSGEQSGMVTERAVGEDRMDGSNMELR